MLCKKKKKTEKRRCYGAQCIMGRTIKIAVVFTQHGVGLVRSASGGLTSPFRPLQFPVVNRQNVLRPFHFQKIAAVKYNIRV